MVVPQIPGSHDKTLDLRSWLGVIKERTEWLRNIDARQAWVEAMRDDSLVTLEWVPTADNLADLNLTFLGVQTFEKQHNQIMVPKPIPAYAPHTA